MKSFKQFCEEASLSDLIKKHRSSPEGKAEIQAQSRQGEVIRATQEARKRENQSDEFTKKNKDTEDKKSEAENRSKEQKNKSAQRILKQNHQNEVAKQKVKANVKNAKEALKGTYEFGKSVVKAIKK